MKKTNQIILSVACGTLLLGTVGLILGISGCNSKKRDELYAKGLKHLIDAEYKEATEIFANPLLKHYKDSPKKYNYSFNLQRYEQKAYSYEDLIDFGLKESGSVATVDFDTKGGSEVAKKVITEKISGTYITETTSKAHFDFLNWNLAFACYELESDSIRYFLESNFTNHPYLINYNLDGGSADSLPTSYYYNYGEISIPNASKTGHTFLGYESNLYEDVRKNFVIPNGTCKDVNLTAKYSPNSYHVRFDGNPVVVSEEIDVTFGENITSKLPPNPERNFYSFECWTYNNKPVDLTSWNIDHDVTLVAKYSPIEYRISYVLNGATNPGLPESYNTLSDIDLPFVEKDNALFVGWLDDHGSSDPSPKAGIHHGSHEDRTIEAVFVDADIENGVLKDVVDHTIETLVIPSYVTDISTDFFSKLPELLLIYVDSSNEHFSVDNNILIKDEHIAFAQAKKYTIYHQNVVLPNIVTEIGENAFKDLPITKLSGSDLVTKIGSNAFNNCTSLEEVNLSGVEYIGNYAFANTKLTNDFINANRLSINHIGEYAFKNTLVSKVEILSNIKQICDYAYANLSGVTSVDFYPDQAAVIGEKLFDGSNNIVTLNTETRFFKNLMATSFADHSLKTINLKGGANIENNSCVDYGSLKTLDLSMSTITQVGSSAFKNNTALETVILPSQMVRINASAFEGCTKLADVNFDDLANLFSIRENSFKGAAFTSLDFTNNPHLIIEDHAFTSNSKLTSITMYHGQVVTRIADVFDLCHKITNVTYKIPATTESKVTLPNFLFEDLNNVTNITIEYLGTDEVKEVQFGDYAFKGASSLIDVTMTNCEVKRISKHCFEGCSSLTNTLGTFSNKVHYEVDAFFGCISLSNISFTGTVMIDDGAFAGCYSLTSIFIPKIEDHPIQLGVGVFNDLSSTIEFDYTESEVIDLKDKPRTGIEVSWKNFDEGFSGSFVYKV